MGNRDHSTVLSGVNKIKDEIKKNETSRNTIETIKKKLNPQLRCFAFLLTIFRIVSLY